MANLQGSTYEPRVDNIRGFEAAEEEEEAQEGSRLPLLIVIALLVLAAFGGVVWLAYTQGVERGRADAPRIIVAQSGPIKEAPANPGGESIPYTGLKIYQQAAPADESAGEAGEARHAGLPPTAPSSAPPALRAAANGTPGSSAKTEPKAKTAPSPGNVAGSATASPPVATHAAALLAQSAVVATAPTPQALNAPAASEIYALQIGAYKSEDEAKDSWRVFEGRHPVVAGYPFEIKQVDLGEKGVWYRLRIGSFADKDAAAAFCAKLKADGATCFLAK